MKFYKVYDVRLWASNVKIGATIFATESVLTIINNKLILVLLAEDLVYLWNVMKAT